MSNRFKVLFVVLAILGVFLTVQFNSAMAGAEPTGDCWSWSCGWCGPVPVEVQRCRYTLDDMGEFVGDVWHWDPDFEILMGNAGWLDYEPYGECIPMVDNGPAGFQGDFSTGMNFECIESEIDIELQCPCDDGWKNHGKYVRCVAHVSEDFVSQGFITEDEGDGFVSEAAQSQCGK